MWRFVAILALIACVSTAAAQSKRPAPGPSELSDPPQAKSGGATSGPGADQRGTDQAPLIVKVLPAPKTEEETDRDARQEDEKSTADWWMVKLTGALVGVGILQLLVFGWQGWHLRDTVRTMKKIDQGQATNVMESIAQATRSAVAMENVSASMAQNAQTVTDMAKTQKRFWESQMRAYVLPDQCSLWDGLTLNPPQPHRADVPGVVLIIKNSGLTPAYGVISWAQIEVIDVKNENTLVAPPLQKVFPSTVAQHATFNKSMWFTRALTPHELSDIQTGVRAVYVYGRIEYQDVFKESRYTNFRLRYIGIWPPPPGHILGFSESGNDAT